MATRTVINVRELFPHITDEQAKALFAGEPLPPSPGWVSARDQPPAVSPPSRGSLSQLPSGDSQRSDAMEEVTAVMAVTDAARYSLAVKALRQFLAQTWPHKRLVIANGIRRPIVERATPGVEEVFVRSSSPASMKNAVLNRGTPGPWMTWNDDEYHHTQLIELLASTGPVVVPVALDAQVRVNVLTGDASQVTAPLGVAAVALFPTTVRYRDDRMFGEDACLLQLLRERGTATRIVPAVGTAKAMARVSFYHGRNAVPESLFFSGVAESIAMSQVPESLLPVLKDVLGFYGYSTER